MAEVFEIALVNPVRFLPEGESDLFELNQEDKCYLQKFITSDVTKIQILSDFPDITAQVREASGNSLSLTLNVVEIDTNILDQTFKCYEIEIDFSQLDPGQYVVVIEYENGISTVPVMLISEPIDVQETQPDTMLFKYKNSENNFSIVFDTGIEFDFRVEGTIKEFTPVSDDIIYNDQLRNSTLLNSVPYRSFKLYIGNAPGLPDWVLDKVNRIMSCDEKSIDGAYYEKIEGAKWEVNRTVEYPFQGINTEIMPVENVFLQRLKTGEQPPEGYTIVEKVINFFANASNLVIADLFRKYTLLKHISIVNYGDEITLTVGTTDGGTEIGEFVVPGVEISGPAEVGTTLNIKWLFVGSETLYLGGLDSSNADVLIDYLQYDETPAQPTPTVPVVIGIGMIVEYYQPAPQFAIDFNVGTGLGNVGTDWFGWAICDGRSGTINKTGKFSKGWASGVLGATGGNTGNSITLTKPQLPANVVNLPNSSVNGRSDDANDRDVMVPAPQQTINVGGTGQPVNIEPESIVALYVMKIA